VKKDRRLPCKAPSKRGQLVGDLANEALMDKRGFDGSDYSVVVKNRGSPPNSWKWEIYRAGRSNPSSAFFNLMNISPSTRFASIEPTTAQPQAQFQLSACSALLGYLIVEVSQMEVLWPLAVSVGSPEVVSVMRPADFNSGIPFLTVFALPTLIFN
jgi:hypothetical protein